MNEERLKKLMEWEAQKPDDAFLKFAIAQEYVSDENDAEAIKYYQLLLANFPDYLASYYQLGKLYERAGEIHQAVGTYEKGKEVAQAAKDIKTFNELNEALSLIKDE
jgi:tetratricopeptide (TPR) repeat protein